MNLDEFQRDVVAWQQRTFPNATVGTIISHLQEEIAELAELPSGEEAADVFMLLLALAGWMDFKLSDAAEAKFAVNQERRWTVTAPGGHTKHSG